jgi:hypothetical protein
MEVVVSPSGTTLNGIVQLFFVNVACFGSIFRNFSFSKQLRGTLTMIRIMRILHEELRLSLTFGQFERLRRQSLLRLLCHQKQFFSAAHLATTWSIPLSEISREYVLDILASTPGANVAYQRLAGTTFVDVVAAATQAHQKGQTQVALQLLAKSQRYDQNALLCAEMRQWEESVRFLRLALNQDVVYKVIQMSRGDAEVVPFLRASRSVLHFGLNFPEIVDDDGMKTLLHEATPEVTEIRQKFGLRRTKPLLVLDALVPMLTKLRDFQQQADGDTTLSANRVILKLIRIRNKKQIKLFTTQCKINHKKTYVMRLRYYVQNKEWQAFRELAAKSKCSKLKGLCVELLHLHGGEHERVRRRPEVGDVSREIWTRGTRTEIVLFPLVQEL